MSATTVPGPTPLTRTWCARRPIWGEVLLFPAPMSTHEWLRTLVALRAGAADGPQPVLAPEPVARPVVAPLRRGTPATPWNHRQ